MIATADPQTDTARAFTVDLPYSVFALAETFTAAIGGSRPVLACVCLDLSNGYAIAADGFQLAKVPMTIRQQDGATAPRSYVLIRRDDFATAKKLAKRNATVSIGITNFASDGLGVRVGFLLAGKSGEIMVPATAQPGTFPDVDQLIPRDQDDDVMITLSPDLVANIAALAKADAGALPRLVLRVPANPLQPVRTTLPSGTVMLTMPMDPTYCHR